LLPFIFNKIIPSPVMGISLYQTSDNSHTLYHAELDETYHSRNGAVEESLYVFIDKGFQHAIQHKTQLNILEIGFGTGLNAILTCIEASKTNTSCLYETLETYPLGIELIEQLNYPTYFDADKNKYVLMHQVAWNVASPITPQFCLHKIEQSIHQYTPSNTYDLVYFDAFGPDKQPDMWTPEVFEKLFSWMNPNGVFVTYSAKGAVRRALKDIGFSVELLPGPPRKRHMLRAIKPIQ
jgi:tRNA U34 5-methylaminomethyl-2-thiouridine-forming methyltransferase MnmC